MFGSDSLMTESCNKKNISSSFCLSQRMVLSVSPELSLCLSEPGHNVQAKWFIVLTFLVC